MDTGDAERAPMSLGTKLRGKPLILIAGIVAALFCSAGIATIMDWGVSVRASDEYAGMIAVLKRVDINRSVMARRDTRDTVARAGARCVGGPRVLLVRIHRPRRSRALTKITE